MSHGLYWLCSLWPALLGGLRLGLEDFAMQSGAACSSAHLDEGGRYLKALLVLELIEINFGYVGRVNIVSLTVVENSAAWPFLIQLCVYNLPIITLLLDVFACQILRVQH